MRKYILKNYLVFIELLAACTIVAAAILLVGRSFYFCDNSLYIASKTGLSLYAKVEYIVKCLQNGDAAFWFPYWYNGTPVTQYYPPMIFIILAPLEFFLKNSTMCFKVFVFSSLFVGGMGVRRVFTECLHKDSDKPFLGINSAYVKLFGTLAAILYAALPHFSALFLESLIPSQVLAAALSPWYIFSCIRMCRKPGAASFSSLILLTVMLMASHTAQYCLIGSCVLLAYLFSLNKTEKKHIDLVFWLTATILATGLFAFWLIPGALTLENPEASVLIHRYFQGESANLLWFFPQFADFIGRFFPNLNDKNLIYFPFSIIAIALSSLYFIRREKDEAYQVLRFLYIQMIITFIISFGWDVSAFFGNNTLGHTVWAIDNLFSPVFVLFVGRALLQTALTAAILTAYFFSKVVSEIYKSSVRFIKDQKNVNSLQSFIVLAITFAVSTVWIVGNYSYSPTVHTEDYAAAKDLFSRLDSEVPNFEKGRIACFDNIPIEYSTYFSYLANYNSILGGDLEGLLNLEIVDYQYSAIYAKKFDFLLKQMNNMNVQIALFDTNGDSRPFADYLQENGFEFIFAMDNILALKRGNRSYFAEQTRDCIAIGRISRLFVPDHPWFAEGHSQNPIDYTAEDLEPYKIIYFAEPLINDTRELIKFDALIDELAKRGKNVFVEFGRNKFPTSTFGVSANQFPLDDLYTIVSNDRFNGTTYNGGIPNEVIVSIHGVDEVIYKLKRSYGDYTLDYIGAKHTEYGNNVYFIGGPQRFGYGYLTETNSGNPALDERNTNFEAMLMGLFSGTDYYKKTDLPIFNAENVVWEANECKFSYEADNGKRIMVSISYSPKWKVFIDGTEVKTHSVDTMLHFDAPAGAHNVVMRYGTTSYNTVGRVISLISLILFLLSLTCYKKLSAVVVNRWRRAAAYFNRRLIDDIIDGTNK